MREFIAGEEGMVVAQGSLYYVTPPHPHSRPGWGSEGTRGLCLERSPCATRTPTAPYCTLHNGRGDDGQGMGVQGASATHGPLPPCKSRGGGERSKQREGWGVAGSRWQSLTVADSRAQLASHPFSAPWTEVPTDCHCQCLRLGIADTTRNGRPGSEHGSYLK